VEKGVGDGVLENQDAGEPSRKGAGIKS